MSNTDSENPLLVEHEPPLGWMIINRPQRRNALNYAAWVRIVEAVDELTADPDVRVIIMRGVTPEAFISGADISEFPGHNADAEQARRYRSAPSNATNALINCPKPVIAMIWGSVLAAEYKSHFRAISGLRRAARGLESRRHALASPIPSTGSSHCHKLPVPPTLAIS